MVATLAREAQQPSHPVAAMAGEWSGPPSRESSPCIAPVGFPGVQSRVVRAVSRRSPVPWTL